MSDSVFKESEQSQESDTVERIKNRNLGQEPVPYPVFVKAWQESNNYDEVALKIGRSTHTVAHISNKLRKAGVKLKSMRTTALRGEALDVGALNALIDGGDEQEG